MILWTNQNTTRGRLRICSTQGVTAGAGAAGSEISERPFCVNQHSVFAPLIGGGYSLLKERDTFMLGPVNWGLGGFTCT